MARLTKSQQRTMLIASHHMLTQAIHYQGPAVDNLDDCQPGYPSGHQPGTSNPDGTTTYNDRTGDLAARTLAGHIDIARRDREELDRLTHVVVDAIRDLHDLARRWNPPSSKWRDALATEAAANLEDVDCCQSCIRVGVIEAKRSPGGRLCSWCQGVTRDIGGEPPVWLVEKRRQGGRINSMDIAKAKREVRNTKKGKR